MLLSMIVAIGQNRQIGLDNKMLWHIPAEFKNFKKHTMGKPIIMGRKTFESIGRPLPGRLNIILTRDSNYSKEGITTVSTLEEALEVAAQTNAEEAVICGGAQIYKETINQVSKLYLTIVDYDGEADAFFPEYEKFDWKETHTERHEATESTPEWNLKVLEK